MARANRLANKYGRSRAMKMAWRAEKLIAELHTTEVKFSFIKEDGTCREAFGTLIKEIIEKVWTPKGAEPKPNPEVVRYFDIQAEGWRSFRVDRVKF